MAQTANYGFEKPSTEKNVDEEFYQLQETLDLLDSILAALQTAVNGKSAVEHTHAISDIVNLAAELAAKMPASATFKLDDLTDVSGADGAPNGYVLVKSALGWLPSSALAALGPHGHLISEITGLVDALAGKVALTDLASGSVTAVPTDGSVSTAKLANSVLSADTTGRAKMADGFVTLAKTESGLIPDFVQGLTLSNSTANANNGIDIAVGQAKGNSRLVTSSAIVGKRLDQAWTAGGTAATPLGGLDTGSKGNSTTYHVHAIVNNTTGVFDALFSLSATAPTVPSGWTRVQRLGAILTDGSGTIRPFIQDKNDFYYNTVQSSLPNDLSTTSTRSKSLLTCVLPSGIRVKGVFQYAMTTSSGDSLAEFVFADGANSNIERTARIYASTATKGLYGVIEQYSNTSAQVNVALTLSSTAAAACTVKTLGFRDYQIPRI